MTCPLGIHHKSRSCLCTQNKKSHSTLCTQPEFGTDVNSSMDPRNTAKMCPTPKLAIPNPTQVKKLSVMRAIRRGIKQSKQAASACEKEKTRDYLPARAEKVDGGASPGLTESLARSGVADRTARSRSGGSSKLGAEEFGS